MLNTYKNCPYIADNMLLNKNRYENQTKRLWGIDDSIYPSDIIKPSISYNPMEYRILAKKCRGLYNSFYIIHVIADMSNLNVKIYCKDKKGNLLLQAETIDQKNISHTLQLYTEVCIRVQQGLYSNTLNKRYIDLINNMKTQKMLE